VHHSLARNNNKDYLSGIEILNEIQFRNNFIVSFDNKKNCKLTAFLNINIQLNSFFLLKKQKLSVQVIREIDSGNIIKPQILTPFEFLFSRQCMITVVA